LVLHSCFAYEFSLPAFISVCLRLNPIGHRFVAVDFAVEETDDANMRTDAERASLCDAIAHQRADARWLVGL